MLTNFQSAREDTGETQATETRDNSSTLWKKPANDHIKVNWDAATDSKTKNGGFGIIARNRERELLADVCSRKSNTAQPELAESLSLMQAIKFCQDSAYQNVILEGGALNIIQVVTSAETNMSWFGHIIEDIKASLARHPS